MMVLRGDIWLVNFNPVKKNNEVGKVRPALVLQTNELNEGQYPTTIVLPLTTQLIDDAQPLRYRIEAQDFLKETSDVLVAQIRSIDNSRFIQKLATISSKETDYIKTLLDEVLA